MKYIQMYINAFKQMLNWKGKSTRTEFWSFVICGMIVSALLGCILATAATIYAIIALIPSITLVIRRARDTGYSPFLALVILIPVIGMLVLGLLPSKK